MTSEYTLVIWSIWGELLGMECQLTRSKILVEDMEEIEKWEEEHKIRVRKPSDKGYAFFFLSETGRSHEAFKQGDLIIANAFLRHEDWIIFSWWYLTKLCILQCSWKAQIHTLSMSVQG